MFIYLIVNHVTGKYYVGQHKGNNLKKYLQDKLSQASYELKRGRGGRSHLFNSMRKHPKEVWSIHALLSDVQTRVELDAYERDFISFLKSQDPEYGYNICRGGEGFSGPHRPESKAKVTKALKKRWAQPGFKEHWTELMTGHDTSPETIEKIKAARAEQDEASRLVAFNEWKDKKLSTDPDHFKKIGAAASREDKVRAGRMGSREDKQRAGRIAAKSLPKAIHTRWHVNRGLISPTCQLCVPSVGNTQ
jgi:hypothetical protein